MEKEYSGSQMKTWQKALFILILVIFVTMSVTISLISISRAPYKFREETAIGGDETLNGWVFERFNGNAGTKTLAIDYVRDKNGNNPDETKPIVAVGTYCVNADEYVQELVIGPSVQRIEETAFFNFRKLQKVTVNPANKYFKDIDGVLLSKDGKTLMLYPACYGQTPTEKKGEYEYPTAYVVPQGVEHISCFAFLKNEHLRDLTLPDSLREIGDMAFFGCSRLGAYEYDEATDSLLGTGFTLPDGLELIGSDAFSKCGNIAPVLYFPLSVTQIRHHAFFNSTGLKNIFFAAADHSALELGESWRPKNIKAGPMWKAPEPQFGKTREESETLIESYRAEQLNALREEAQKNG